LRRRRRARARRARRARRRAGGLQPRERRRRGGGRAGARRRRAPRRTSRVPARSHRRTRASRGVRRQAPAARRLASRGGARGRARPDGGLVPRRGRRGGMITRPPRARLATLVLAGAVTALYLAFVGYGYQLEDEGTILYQILRTYRGERPYLDFHTGYTPAIFYLNAWLFRTFGVSVVPIRLSLVAVNTIAVVTLFRL